MRSENISYEGIFDVLCDGLHVSGDHAFISGFRPPVTAEIGRIL